jgi:hypothetical protein
VETGHFYLGKRLDEIGWALFLLMMGALWLMPAESVPEQTWIILGRRDHFRHQLRSILF